MNSSNSGGNRNNHDLNKVSGSRVKNKMEQKKLEKYFQVQQRNDLMVQQHQQSKKKSLQSPQGIQKQRSPKLYQTSMKQMIAGRFGLNAGNQLQPNFSKKDFADKWRMGQQNSGYGGHGQDELISTSTAKNHFVNNGNQLTSNQFNSQLFKSSMDRQDTAASVWYTGSKNSDGSWEMGGHPGALRNKTQIQTKKGTTNIGHNSRDKARAYAANTESQATFFSSTQQRARVKVETIRTMTTPLQEFQDKGMNSQGLTHAVGGDISQNNNFGRMAEYVHENRERMKWDAAGQMMKTGSGDHVDPQMRQYIKNANGDHTQAMLSFHNDASESLRNNTTFQHNTAKTSSAGPLLPDETLAGTANQVQQGRKRALSSARIIPGLIKK